MAATDPVWSDKGDALFYLSERSGDFNVWRRDLASGKEQQLTHYKGHPVRGLSASSNGDLVWSWLGELYRLDADSKVPRKLHITPQAASEPDEISQSLTQVDDVLVNEEGNELILVSEGNLFAVDSEHSRVRQLTHDPSEQSSLIYAEQGRSLIYLSEQAGHAALYRLRKTDPKRPFCDPGPLIESLLLAIPGQGISDPVLSPDGKQLAFVVDGQAIHLLDMESNRQRELVPASLNAPRPQDSKVDLAFSPNSRYLAISLTPNPLQQTIALIDTHDLKAKPINVSLNSYQDKTPVWSKDGRILYWQSSKPGRHGNSKQPWNSNLLGIYSNRAAKADFLAERKPAEQGYSVDLPLFPHNEALSFAPNGNVRARRIVNNQLIYLVEQPDSDNDAELRGYSKICSQEKTNSYFPTGMASIRCISIRMAPWPHSCATEQSPGSHCHLVTSIHPPSLCKPMSA